VIVGAGITLDHLVSDAAAVLLHTLLAGVLLLLGALNSASTSSQQQQARSSSSSSGSFAPWREPQHHQHINAAGTRGSSSQQHAANTVALRQRQQQQQQRLVRGVPSSTIPVAAVPSRSLLQSATSYQPPKFFISNVKATVVNTYEWQISRQSTAGGVTLTANGQERQQMGEWASD
jgi:hypothetical protein